MNRTPVEWISIGAGTLILGLFLLIGLATIGIGLYAMAYTETSSWRIVVMGVVVLAIPAGLYGVGRATGRAWLRIGRSRP